MKYSHVKIVPDLSFTEQSRLLDRIGDRELQELCREAAERVQRAFERELLSRMAPMSFYHEQRTAADKNTGAIRAEIGSRHSYAYPPGRPLFRLDV